MANLLTDLSLTSAYTVTGSFAVITGMTTTVTIAGTGSVVLLAMTLNPELVSDECAEYRFTHDGARVGPVVSSFVDATNDGLRRISLDSDHRRYTRSVHGRPRTSERE